MNLMNLINPMNKNEVSMPNEHFPWVIFRLQDQFFAISSSYIQSMIELSHFKHVPNAPEYVRGVVDYQGQPVYLIDMRKKIGIQPLAAEIEEFIELMNAREADHKNWLNALEQCINEGKAFTLATDPAKCRFGQWYLEFLPTVKNNNLSFWLKKFDPPHKRIHGIAQQVLDLLHQDKKEQAIQLIEKTRDGDLDRMIQLFSKLKEIRSCR
ncbi:MAG: CheW-like protein [Pseudomonadota bacterium]|nr:CheW-like protein [Pseudomonadota bacterium]